MTRLEHNIKATCERLTELCNLSTEEREEREERGEIAYICEWLSYEAADIEYAISSDGEYRGAFVWVAIGGPTVWIDTRNGRIEGRYGTERAELWLPSEICDALDACLEEDYHCLQH